MIGFAVTLLAVLLYSWFTLRQVASLRSLQSDIVDRNRRDSIQLLNIQSTLDSLGSSLHDILEDPYGISSFEKQFTRLRKLLRVSIEKEAALSRAPLNQQQGSNNAPVQLTGALQEFDRACDQVFALARAGHSDQASTLIVKTLRPSRNALKASVDQMLVQNNNLDLETENRIGRIYDGVERDLYTFLAATVIAIGMTGIALLYSNRRIFSELASLSEQKSTLARKLISVQEEVLRSISRELHDEFGQILTAIGAMLGRLERKGIPPESPLRADLAEVREITAEALEKVRSLSQVLHPAVIDDYGLEKAVEWYVPIFERQTGIAVDYRKMGTGPAIKDEMAIHVYRILQEALNNVAKHSGVKKASVRVHYAPDQLRLEVEDRGRGFGDRASRGRDGLGLVAMRERSELVHGKLKLESTVDGGTLVSLVIPLRQNMNTLISVTHDH